MTEASHQDETVARQPYEVEGQRLGWALIIAAMRHDHEAAGALLGDLEPSVTTAALQFAVAAAAVAALRNADLSGVSPERVITALRQNIIDLEQS